MGYPYYQHNFYTEEWKVINLKKFTELVYQFRSLKSIRQNEI